ncbi:MAG: hypothetical protein RI897_806 [Verrucomicrobiota bacterium]
MDCIADAAAMAVGGGDGDDIEAAFHEGADVVEDTVAVEFAEGVTGGGYGGAADEAVLGIAGGFKLGVPFEGDAFDVTEGEEAMEVVLGIDDEEFMDAGVFGEEGIGGGDGVGAEVVDEDCMDLGSGGEGFDGFPFGVAGFDHVAGEEAEEGALVIDDGESAEGEASFFDHFEHFTDELVWVDLDGVLDEAVDVVFDAADFGELLFLRHVVVDEAESAVEGHGDGHGGFRDRIHIGGDDGDMEFEVIGEFDVQLGIAGQDFGVERGERDVVVGQRGIREAGEERVSVLVEVLIPICDVVGVCHGACFGKRGW